MALRAVPDHPKFADLKQRLGRSKGATLGYLECVWHFAGRFTPQGNIGKYSDSAIEAWVEWDGEPGLLVASLIDAKWIDLDPFHRILVHDWATHADKATKQALNRAKLEFCVPTVHTPGAHNVDLIALPVPVPVPVPVPESVPESSTRAPIKFPSLPQYKLDETYLPMIELANKFWPDSMEEDFVEAHFKWRTLSFEQKLEAQANLSGKVAFEGSGKGQFVCKTFAKYLAGSEWKRKPRDPPASSEPKPHMSAREKARNDELMRP